ncbi:hypothetical protein CC78DRAFT_547807 [Lojkania enalia]|uniref:Uncharacterized protein n=1 Tax=Lojkania enalia TaxID=147567 RepID=A0A9P4K0P7_9PLEO|nr:hypothetical protein CC78DRAFT_547807 [Didymosphaeria enalia]
MATPSLSSIAMELKVMIVREVLADREIVIEHRTANTVSASPNLDTAILYTSRDIYTLAVFVMYHFNHFHMNDMRFAGRPVLAIWTQSIGRRNVEYLGSLQTPIRVLKPSTSEDKQLKLAVECTRAAFVRSQIITLSMISTHATKLRSLTLSLPNFSADDTNSMILHIGILKAVSSITQLTKITISGTMPHIWVTYLNRTLGAQMTAKSLHVVALGLKEIVLCLEAEIAESKRLIGGAVVNEEEIKHGSWEGEEEKEDMANGVIKKSEHYLTASMPITKLELDVIAVERDLHSGRFWPPVEFHKEELRVEREKLRILVGFWEELVLRGVLKPAGAAEASE